MNVLTTIKIIIELLGVFLLSIEAIKIKRLMDLVNYLKKTGKYANRKNNELMESPTGGLIALGMFFAVVGGVILLIHSPNSDSFWWRALVVLCAVCIFAGLSLILQLALLGILRYFSAGAVKALTSLSAKTPDGTIGIAGFMLVFVAAMGEITMLWTLHAASSP